MLKINSLHDDWMQFVSKHLFGFNSANIAQVYYASENAYHGFYQYMTTLRKSVPEMTEEERVSAFAAIAVGWTRGIVRQRLFPLEIIVRSISGRDITSMLDLGCGLCAIPAFLQTTGLISGRIVGIDISDVVLAQARDLLISCEANIELIRGWIEHLPALVGNEQFELVISMDGIGCSDHWKEELAQLPQVCKQNGLFISHHPVLSEGADDFKSVLKTSNEFKLLEEIFDPFGDNVVCIFEKN